MYFPLLLGELTIVVPDPMERKPDHPEPVFAPLLMNDLPPGESGAAVLSDPPIGKAVELYPVSDSPIGLRRASASFLRDRARRQARMVLNTVHLVAGGQVQLLLL